MVLVSNHEANDESQSAELTSQLDHAFGGFSSETIAHCRNYLKLVAQHHMDTGLQAKFSPSDLVQETLLQAWRRGSQFRGATEQEFLAWLTQILQNHLVDQQRRFRGSAKRNVRVERQLGEKHAGNAQENSLIHESHSPLSKAELAEESMRLNTAMEELADDHQQVLRLRNWESLEFAEIGRRMDRSAAAARQLWVRALACLQRALEKTKNEKPKSEKTDDGPT